MTSHATIAVTGGSGAIASVLRPLLAQAGHEVRLIDIAEPSSELLGNESLHLGSVADQAFMAEALAGADAVVHLGGIHREKTWAQLNEANITGTYVMLEAARTNGIRKVLIASSTHAVGYTPVTEAAADGALYPRPDTLYGVTKVAMEALGSLFSDKFGMKVISVRIGTGGMIPTNVRSQSTWLSAGDTLRLVEALLSDENPGENAVIWGVSNNSYGWANLEAGRRIGFDPQDDALDLWEGERVELDAPRTGSELLLGGNWATAQHHIGVDNYPELEKKARS